MTLDLDLVGAFVLTTGMGYVMMRAGIGKNVLEWRRRPRICPSCGRHLTGRSCSCAR